MWRIPPRVSAGVQQGGDVLTGLSGMDISFDFIAAHILSVFVGQAGRDRISRSFRPYCQPS